MTLICCLMVIAPAEIPIVVCMMKVLNTMVGLKYHRDNTKAKKPLGWNQRPANVFSPEFTPSLGKS